MSGRRKGLEGQREAAAELRAFGLRVVIVLRDGAGPDVDLLVELAPGRWHAVQVKREESARPGAWRRRYVRPGASVMWRRNREPWTLELETRGGRPASCDVEAFAAYAMGGVLP